VRETGRSSGHEADAAAVGQHMRPVLALDEDRALGGSDLALANRRADLGERFAAALRPDRFRCLITILGVVERFRQPLDLFPIDAGHVRMDVRNIRWLPRQKSLQHVLAGLQALHP
jgi:hypothetical protein